jgi:Fe-S cluster biogenesis protein NfuA
MTRMGFLSKILGVDLEPSVPETITAHSTLEMSGDESLEARIEAILESIRPALHADGGDIELIEVVGNSAKVRLTGACDGCPSAALTLRFGIEARLRQAIPDFEDLIPI